MKRLSSKIVAVGLGLIGCLVLFACNDDGVSINPPAGSPAGIGLVDNVPRIQGDWLAQTTLTGNTCGAIAGVPPDQMTLRIMQADTAIQIEIETPCGADPIEAAGTLTPSNVLTATSTRSLVVSQNCTLELSEALTAIANNAGDQIDGSTTITITPVDTPTTDCGGGFPCTVDAAFVAERCPPADCNLPACAAATGP